MHQVRERDLEFHESIVVSQILEEAVFAEFVVPTEVEKAAPIVILHDTENKIDKPDEDEPKRFLEKKQKYGRDAQKLYATYQGC